MSIEFSPHSPNRNKELVDLVAKLTPDEWTLAIARLYMFGHGFKLAVEHLNYYLDGNERPKLVDLNALLSEDQGIRRYVFSSISNSLKRSLRSGTLHVEQFHFQTRQWQYALGGFKLTWKIVDPPGIDAKPITVEIFLKNRYKWHPDEPRFTQALHAAADRLKRKRAREFWMVGSTKVRF